MRNKRNEELGMIASDRRLCACGADKIEDQRREKNGWNDYAFPHA
jgi:hypothetical protein